MRDISVRVIYFCSDIWVFRILVGTTQICIPWRDKKFSKNTIVHMNTQSRLLPLLYIPNNLSYINEYKMPFCLLIQCNLVKVIQALFMLSERIKQKKNWYSSGSNAMLSLQVIFIGIKANIFSGFLCVYKQLHQFWFIMSVNLSVIFN